MPHFDHEKSVIDIKWFHHVDQFLLEGARLVRFYPFHSSWRHLISSPRNKIISCTLEWYPSLFIVNKKRLAFKQKISMINQTFEMIIGSNSLLHKSCNRSI